MIEQKPIVRFKRPCKYCDKMFLPNGKFVKLCKKCLEESRWYWREMKKKKQRKSFYH